MRKTFAALALMALASTVVSGTAHAAGCVSGGVVGGVAGHMAGHGVAGAAVGCAVGHHENTVNKRKAAAQNNANNAPAQRTPPANQQPH